MMEELGRDRSDSARPERYNYLCPELSLLGILYLLNFFSLTLFEGDKAMLSYHIRRLPNIY